MVVLKGGEDKKNNSSNSSNEENSQEALSKKKNWKQKTSKKAPTGGEGIPPGIPCVKLSAKIDQSTRKQMLAMTSISALPWISGK